MLTDVSDPTRLARLLAQLSGDLVLVMDTHGRIRTAVAGPDTPAGLDVAAWEGHDWADTVSPETGHKVARILSEVAASGRSGRKELNHPMEGGGWSAWAYHAVRIDDGQTCLAMGRDLRAQSALQQRLLRAQCELEARGWPSSS